jgi:peptidoglycan/xylan/chitin deacetylase (PgdA/CDA1 family)
MLSKLRSAPAVLASWLGAVRHGGTRILMYHGTPRRDARRLERQLAWLRRHFQVVPLQAVIGLEPHCRPSVALTFDDGLRSNVQVAYPILKRLGLHATFFVCPGLIDRGGWLWNHEARQRLAHAGESVDTVEWMKTLPSRIRQDVEARIREVTPGFAPSPEQREDFDLATWDELRSLDARVVSVGSHTLNHPILPLSPPHEVEAEVRESRSRIEAELQRPVETFAYPNGAYDELVHGCVRRHYRVAVAVDEGTVKEDCDPHLLPRIAAPRGTLRLAKKIGTDPIYAA